MIATDDRVTHRTRLSRIVAAGIVAVGAFILSPGWSAQGAGVGNVAPTGTIVSGNPANYLDQLKRLKPGDTLQLAAGNYGVDAYGRDTEALPGLAIFGLNGTATAPIVITGPERGPRPTLVGRAAHNTIRIADSSYVVIRNLDVENRGLGAAAVASQGVNHHITIENLNLRGVGNHQQTVAISCVKGPNWNWIIRGNVIIGAGTGIYLGNSDGTAPFVAGLIERNLIVDTIGYNIEIKHQVPWVDVPAGMPTGATTTVIRHNTFVKRNRYVSSDGARPNLLIGDQPDRGPGSANGFEIYGNFFYENPSEALFQGEGRFAFHDNVMVNSFGSAVRVHRHNGLVRNVDIFHNTIVAKDEGIYVAGGALGSTQRVTGNVVFAAAAISVGGPDTIVLDNTSGRLADAAGVLASPFGMLPTLDLHLRDARSRAEDQSFASQRRYLDADRDFDGATRSSEVRGAYATPRDARAWTLGLGVKP